MSKVEFTKSLKFKLTVWYSLLLSVFCILFVVAVNIWLSNYMQRNIKIPTSQRFDVKIGNSRTFRNLTEDQLELLQESRSIDLNNIRKITFYSIVPLIVLSFAGGYLIASLSLNPLEKFSQEISKKSMKNLEEEIKFEDKGDEISHLIKAFNRMSRRLNKNFNAQKEFVQNASHELKTPLAIIQANLDTALEDGNINEKELQELLESSKENIKFMNKLTEDLLLLSILEQEVELEKINIVDLVKHCIFDLKKLFKIDNIKIKQNYPKEKVFIKANPVLFERAIMNILENAVKYSGCRNLEISVKKTIKEVHLTIKDDGKGLAKKHLDRIFDRFYRVDKSRSRKTGGSGLGLAITKEIIETLNGQISVDSEKGKGTKFLIKFS